MVTWQAASTVFADAGEEYADIAAVKVRLEDWQAQYLSAFNDAYMGISAPAIFAPFVRSQLLCWDPLYMPGTGIYAICLVCCQNMDEQLNYVCDEMHNDS